MTDKPETRVAMRPIQVEAFPAGQQAGHCMVNESDAPCRYLVIGERVADDVCVYPDSNKVLVSATGEIYDRSATRAYWDGEDTE